MLKEHVSVGSNPTEGTKSTVIVQWYTCEDSEHLHRKWEIAVQFRKQLGQTETFRGFTTVAYKWWKSVLLYGVFSNLF